MMNAKRIDRMNLDIAALQTLRTVFDTTSFSEAARLLDVNQSTISYTMERLRQIFDDPLFVRSGRGVVATERCAEIVDGALQILRRFETISQPQSFDPASASFRVVFALDHKERAILMTRIVRYLRRHAPGISIQIMYGHRHGHSRLRDGVCDFLLTPDDYDSPTLYRKRLYREDYVCVVDRASPHAEKGIILADYTRARHIVVSYENMRRPSYVIWLEREGLRFDPVLDLTSTSEVERFVQGTDLVATVPSRLAATYGDSVAVIPAPFEHQVDTFMYWSSRTHRADNMRWIRDLVLRAAAQDGELE